MQPWISERVIDSRKLNLNSDREGEYGIGSSLTGSNPLEKKGVSSFDETRMINRSQEP